MLDTKSHTVSGLMAKHQELISLIDFHSGEVAKLNGALRTITDAIKLLSPDTDLRVLGNKRPRKKYTLIFKKGECQALVLKLLRRTDGMMSTTDIINQVIEEKRFPRDDDTMKRLRNTILGRLNNLRTRKLIVCAGRDGDSLVHLWRRV